MTLTPFPGIETEADAVGVLQRQFPARDGPHLELARFTWAVRVSARMQGEVPA
jgi:hypothetical protein